MEIRAPAELVPCVLLVEDDSDHRAVFRSFLERRGWRVAEAVEAAPAHDLIGSPDVGVVVVDLGGTDGWSLLETVGARAHRPPLLCLTGDARPSSRERATRLGADVYLTKADPARRVRRLDRPAGGWTGRGACEPPTQPFRSDAAEARVGSLQVVLLLEDNDDARIIYRDMLDFAGFEVITACDGIEGLRCAEARHPDVVVTDLHMPGLNGIEVARTLRAADDQTPALIAVTADSLGIRAAENEDGRRPAVRRGAGQAGEPGQAGAHRPGLRHPAGGHRPLTSGTPEDRQATLGSEVRRATAALEPLRTVARWMDHAVRIPGTSVRLGLDAVFGLFPGIGDALGAVVSAWFLVEGIRLGAPPALLARMGMNIGIDALLGAVPLLGDLFDIGWRANARNLALLEGHMADPHRTRRRSAWVVAGSASAVAAALTLLLAASVAVAGRVLEWLTGVL